jgi:hypothetical protein
MGTTLTGTTPQDTYDSLIKVTDNGPLSGTAKFLSDGLGNDSALALSTARVFIGKTTNNSTFNSRLQVVSDNTTAGGVLVDHFQNDATGAFLFLSKSRSNVVGTSTIVQNNDTLGQIDFNGANGTTWSLGATIAAKVDGTAGAANDMPARLIFSTSADGSATPTERMRITSDGYVRLASGASGIQFNGDTAAANALDDYEEGTWTMGVSFGGASVGVTTSANTGAYTKIGRQVTVTGLINLTSKGSSTGGAKITGLPFTIADSSTTYTASSFRINEITFANQFQGFGEPNTTNIVLEEVTILGVNTSITDADFANSSDIMVSLTYYV